MWTSCRRPAWRPIWPGRSTGSPTGRSYRPSTSNRSRSSCFGTDRGSRIPCLRQAIELAVDRRRIGDAVFDGRTVIPRTYLVPPGWAAADVAAGPGADRIRARALLDASGYRRGPFGVLERGPERFTATILVAAGSPARTQVAQLVAGDLAAIGIAADVREGSAAVVRAAVAAGASRSLDRGRGHQRSPAGN